VRAASTLGDTVGVLGSVLDADPPAVRCDEDADGLELPVALSTTIVAIAATTNPTGTRATIRGWRERKLAAFDPEEGVEREVPPLAERLLPVGRTPALDVPEGRPPCVRVVVARLVGWILVGWFLVGWILVGWILVGWGDRAGPVVDFDMWVLLV